MFGTCSLLKSGIHTHKHTPTHLLPLPPNKTQSKLRHVFSWEAACPVASGSPYVPSLLPPTAEGLEVDALP